MRKIRKTLHVKARKNSTGGKFQSEMETVGVLGVADIAERWAESMALKPGMAMMMIGSLEECILDALSDGYQLNFGLVSFYPRLSGALPSRDSDPATEGLYVRGAVKARRALRDGLKEKIDAVNSYKVPIHIVYDGTLKGSAVEHVSSEDVMTDKVLRNGQLIIIKDGVEYNAQGAVIQ